MPSRCIQARTARHVRWIPDLSRMPAGIHRLALEGQLEVHTAYYDPQQLALRMINDQPMTKHEYITWCKWKFGILRVQWGMFREARYQPDWHDLRTNPDFLVAWQRINADVLENIGV